MFATAPQNLSPSKGSQTVRTTATKTDYTSLCIRSWNLIGVSDRTFLSFWGGILKMPKEHRVAEKSPHRWELNLSVNFYLVFLLLLHMCNEEFKIIKNLQKYSFWSKICAFTPNYLPERNKFLREIFGPRSVYYTYQANEKQNANFRVMYTSSVNI